MPHVKTAYALVAKAYEVGKGDGKPLLVTLAQRAGGKVAIEAIAATATSAQDPLAVKRTAKTQVQLALETSSDWIHNASVGDIVTDGSELQPRPIAALDSAELAACLAAIEAGGSVSSTTWIRVRVEGQR